MDMASVPLFHKPDPAHNAEAATPPAPAQTTADNIQNPIPDGSDSNLEPISNSLQAIPPLSAATTEVSPQVNSSKNPESDKPPTVDESRVDISNTTARSDDAPSDTLSPELSAIFRVQTSESGISPSLSARSIPTPPGLGDLHSRSRPDITSTPSTMKGTSAKSKVSSGKNTAPSLSTAKSIPGGSQSNKTSVRRKPSQKHSKKRKSRADDDDESVIKAGDTSSDESSGPSSFATHTKSGRQIHRPIVFYPEQNSTMPPAVVPNGAQASPRKKRRVQRKGKEINVTCQHCDRGHSPQSNPIVFCDDCNFGWHQFCHDPPVDAETVEIQESQWFCGECRPVKTASSAVVSRSTSQRIGSTSISHGSQISVGGSKFTATEKRSYLAGLTHSDLVDLLLRISSTHPDLPIFPLNLLDLSPPVYERRQEADSTMSSTGARDTSTSVPVKPTLQPATNNTSISTAATTTGTLSSTSPPASSQRNQQKQANETTASDDELEYIEDHRLYPRAGNGFRLPPDSVDLNMLLEDPSSTTFSHALHGPAKARAEAMKLHAVGTAV